MDLFYTNWLKYWPTSCGFVNTVHDIDASSPRRFYVVYYRCIFYILSISMEFWISGESLDFDIDRIIDLEFVEYSHIRLTILMTVYEVKPYYKVFKLGLLDPRYMYECQTSELENYFMFGAPFW